MKALLSGLKPKSALFAAVVNTAAYIFMICVNIAADAVPMGGITAMEVSQLFFNLLTPAPYAFLIWGFIYLLLGQFCIYSFGIFSKDGAHKPYVLAIGYLFAVSCILNALWLILWHHRMITASFIVMMLLLADIMIILSMIDRQGCTGTVDKLFVRVPFGVYLGWLLTTAAANGAALYAQAARPEAFSQDWNICVLFILLVVLLVFLFRFCCFGAAAAGIWSFSGILARHISFFGLVYPKIIVFCLFAITSLFVLSVIKFIKMDKHKKI